MNLICPKDILENRSSFYIIDIREKYEYELGNIGNTNIPMDEFCSRMDELPKDQKIVLMCKSGKRASALGNLVSVDYKMEDVFVMDGGIEAWKNQIEPTLNIE